MPKRFDHVLSLLNEVEPEPEPEPVAAQPSFSLADFLCRFRGTSPSFNTFEPPREALLTVQTAGREHFRIEGNEDSVIRIDSRFVEATGLPAEIRRLSDEIQELRSAKRVKFFLQITMALALWAAIYHYGYTQYVLLSFAGIMALFVCGFIAVYFVAAMTGL